MTFECFSGTKTVIFDQNTGFSALKPGREPPKPGRGAPVAHTAILICSACILVPGDGLWWAQDARDDV